MSKDDDVFTRLFPHWEAEQRQRDMARLAEMQRNPVASRGRRDEGMDRVLQGEERFVDQIFYLITRLPVGWIGIGEDIRILANELGVPEPHHPNCWGAAINIAVKAGLLQRTNRTRQMTLARSHARSSIEYERI